MRGGVFLENVEAGRRDFPHFADCIARDAFNKFGGDCIRMRVAGLAYVVDKDLHVKILLAKIEIGGRQNVTLARYPRIERRQDENAHDERRAESAYNHNREGFLRVGANAC